MNEGLIAIGISEYELLVKRNEWLECLEAAGVDNWCGWDEAIDIKHSMYDGDD